MKQLYTNPLRIYVILGVLALWGILSGLHLPISLFPNSSQINIAVHIPYGSFSSQQFFDVYGKNLEASLQALKIDSVAVKELRAEYRNLGAFYRLVFEWGADPEKALETVKNLVTTQFANAAEEVRRPIRVNSWNENRGFFAVSFYSPMRSLDELYQILEPLLTPLKSQIEDAGDFELFNPNRKEITLSLLPSKLAQFEVTPLQIQRAVQTSVIGLNGGTLRLGENDYLIDLPKAVSDLDSLSQVRVSLPGKTPIFLKDVAKISMGVSKDSWKKYKTSGVESLILFANPKEGGNIKQMADQILEQMKVLEMQWPSDVQYKILVNPSEFINNSVQSVVHEVFLAAFLAVMVLFLFIGSFKNVITAAIEIPLSLLMAFILMRLAHMNLNMISLGGLALSAGMNVDASVVVLENIVRHFELQKGSSLSYQDKVHLVIKAVGEVKQPIIASTIASLVVFFPLIFTQGLTHSLLGDLAKAVIFSHGLSAVVALILVPTIRLQLLATGQNLESHSPIDSLLRKLEDFYRNTLTLFLSRKKWYLGTISIVTFLLPVLVYFVLPRLEKEVIGKPDSDWLIVGVSSPLFTNLKEMESELDLLDESLVRTFGKEVLYTFTNINGPGNGMIMVRVKDKSRINEFIEKAEDIYKNTSTKFYWVDYWNPSELTIPDPAQFRLEMAGGAPRERLNQVHDFQSLLLEKGIFDKVQVYQTMGREKEIRFKPYLHLGAESEVLSREETSHFLRVVNEGVYVERIQWQNQDMPIYLRWDGPELNSIETLKAIPIGFEGRLIPLGALAQITIEDRPPRIYRENQKALYVLEGRLNKNQMGSKVERQKQASQLVEQFKAQNSAKGAEAPTITEVQADKELQQSLEQLKWAVLISILLVFITMVIQLGDVVHSLLVLVAIPLGFLGVLLSLFIFNSTLSLNSGLGTILLNGIAVANSIILVDFIRTLFESGRSALEATVEASVTRLRPILMTSLTTVLGMLPIALGFGEGGKILQPLGIAVCGGLWISMLLTLYIVPTLQYLYLSRQEKLK